MVHTIEIIMLVVAGVIILASWHPGILACKADAEAGSLLVGFALAAVFM